MAKSQRSIRRHKDKLRTQSKLDRFLVSRPPNHMNATIGAPTESEAAACGTSFETEQSDGWGAAGIASDGTEIENAEFIKIHQGHTR
jgi:hypothetical protein